MRLIQICPLPRPRGVMGGAGTRCSKLKVPGEYSCPGSGSWFQIHRETSEFWDSVCVLVGVLVGLGELGELVCCGPTGGSLLSSLAFRLELFQFLLPPHGRLKLLLDHLDLIFQFRQFLNQCHPDRSRTRSPALAQCQARPGSQPPANRLRPTIGRALLQRGEGLQVCLRSQ